jgi:hypothetical protein
MATSYRRWTMSSTVRSILFSFDLLQRHGVPEIKKKQVTLAKL